MDLEGPTRHHRSSSYTLVTMVSLPLCTFHIIDFRDMPWKQKMLIMVRYDVPVHVRTVSIMPMDGERLDMMDMVGISYL